MIDAFTAMISVFRHLAVQCDRIGAVATAAFAALFFKLGILWVVLEDAAISAFAF